MNKITSFPLKKYRLGKQGFTDIFSNQDIRCHSPAILLIAKKNAYTYPRLGTIIAKKVIKLAVTRNRYKRVMRDYIRLNQSHLPAVDIILRVKPQARSLEPTDLRLVLDDLFSCLSTKYRNLYHA